MRQLFLSLTLGACLPLSGVVAEERTPMSVPEPQPPEPSSRDEAGMLIDTVIPAYGVHHTRPYRPSSSVEHVYHTIQQFTANVDAQVMSGNLARPSATVNEDGVLIREPIAEEQRLGELLQLLAEERLRVPFPNHYELWHIENAQRDLERSAELLRLGLGDDRYLRLEQIHHAWLKHLEELLKQAQHERAQELIENEGMRPLRAIQQAEQEITSVPPPPMRIDASYEQTSIQEVISDEERQRLERAAELEAQRAAAAAAAAAQQDETAVIEDDADDLIIDELIEEEPPREEITIDEAPVIDDQAAVEEPPEQTAPPADEEPEEEDMDVIDDLDDIDWDAL